MADRDRIVAETQARAHQAALADAADGDPGETNEPPVLRNREPVREHQQAARTARADDRCLMATEIVSNGSKWYGQAPDTIEQLLAILVSHPLEPWSVIERSRVSRTVGYFGNFRTISHVFNILTDDPAVIRRLSRAIRANQRRYPASPNPQVSKD